jgi:hypothetical protein
MLGNPLEIQQSLNSDAGGLLSLPQATRVLEVATTAATEADWTKNSRRLLTWDMR